MNLKHCTELTEVGRTFIDAIARNNGRDPQRTPSAGRSSRPSTVFADIDHQALAALVEPLDPDCGYDDWLRVAMALHHASDGCEYGLVIFDEWSMRGRKYPGFAAIEYKWRTFGNDRETPVTIATVIWMLKQQGHIPADIQTNSGSQFEICETERIEPPDITTKPDSDETSLKGGAA